MSTKLENGGCYKVVNQFGIITYLMVRRGVVYAGIRPEFYSDFGASCGSVKKYISHPKFKTLCVERLS